jgi:diacylglycerol kinase family enzyme
VITISRHRRQPLRLFIDGIEVAIAPTLNITVGKNPHLASGLKLAADMAPDDGRLFVFAACGIGRRQLLWALPRLYTGSIARDRRFLLRRAKTVRILPGPAQVRTEFDGDPAGYCPAEIGVLPRAIRLIGAGR